MPYCSFGVLMDVAPHVDALTTRMEPLSRQIPSICFLPFYEFLASYLLGCHCHEQCLLMNELLSSTGIYLIIPGDLYELRPQAVIAPYYIAYAYDGDFAFDPRFYLGCQGIIGCCFKTFQSWPFFCTQRKGPSPCTPGEIRNRQAL